MDGGPVGSRCPSSQLTSGRTEKNRPGPNTASFWSDQAGNFEADGRVKKRIPTWANIGSDWEKPARPKKVRTFYRINRRSSKLMGYRGTDAHQNAQASILYFMVAHAFAVVFSYYGHGRSLLREATIIKCLLFFFLRFHAYLKSPYYYYLVIFVFFLVRIWWELERRSVKPLAVGHKISGYLS